MRNLHRAAFAVILVNVSVHGIAGPLEDALEAESARLKGDYATAMRLARPLAEQGSPLAQYILGFLYRNGLGVPQDNAEAARWFRQSADRGSITSERILAEMYRRGEGVDRDYAEAFKVHRKLADRGDVYSQIYLGEMYRDGQGVRQDYVLAHMWWNIASSTSDWVTAEYAGKKRDALASKMTIEQIAEAQKLAREWKPNCQLLECLRY